MPERLTIKINLPYVGVTSKYVKFYDAFNKDVLIKILMPVVELKFKYNFEFGLATTGRSGNLFRQISKASDLQKMSKADIVSLIASFRTDYKNVLALAADPSIRRLWEEVMANPYVRMEEAGRILGRTPYLGATTSWNPKVTPDLVCCMFRFEYTNPYYYFEISDIRNVRLFLTPDDRRLADMYFNKGAGGKLARVEALPANPDLRVCNAENGIVSAMTYLFGVYSAGQLPGSDGTVNLTRISGIAKRLESLSDFPVPSSIPMDWPSSKSLFSMAYCLYAYANRKNFDNVGLDSALFGKFVWNGLSSYISTSTFNVLFPQFAGFTKTWSQYSTIQSLTEGIEELLREETSAWLDVSGIDSVFMTVPLPAGVEDSPYLKLFSSTARRKSLLRYRNKNNKGVTDWWKEIDLPFVIRWLKLMAACGLLEIVIDVKAEADDYREGLRYVRLTPLGRYAAGIDKKYESKQAVEMVNAFDIDDINLVITVLQSNSPFAPFLGEICDKIGGNRFRVNAKTLVRASSSTTVLDENIRRLLKILPINTDSGHWQAEFDEARQRLNCKRNNLEPMRIVPLDASVPGLVQFVASNPQICEKCLKAEQTILLVPEQFFSDFTAILTKAGYRL